MFHPPGGFGFSAWKVSSRTGTMPLFLVGPINSAAFCRRSIAGRRIGSHVAPCPLPVKSCAKPNGSSEEEAEAAVEPELNFACLLAGSSSTGTASSVLGSGFALAFALPFASALASALALALAVAGAAPSEMTLPHCSTTPSTMHPFANRAFVNHVILAPFFALVPWAVLAALSCSMALMPAAVVTNRQVPSLSTLADSPVESFTDAALP
mmetsp:Transcript_8247/g.14780  ORF Transcript_8247/g.14780 Transcript_8247/m.14780 type:complete len:210 (-) Transcript_8247:88-717(-)